MMQKASQPKHFLTQPKVFLYCPFDAMRLRKWPGLAINSIISGQNVPRVFCRYKIVTYDSRDMPYDHLSLKSGL